MIKMNTFSLLLKDRRKYILIFAKKCFFLTFVNLLSWSMDPITKLTIFTFTLSWLLNVSYTSCDEGVLKCLWMFATSRRTWESFRTQLSVGLSMYSLRPTSGNFRDILIKFDAQQILTHSQTAFIIVCRSVYVLITAYIWQVARYLGKIW